jgi:uroporphyrinogen decarboxylase
MRAAIGAAKQVNPAVVAFYHSDGVVYDIIPDLIEIGVDVLNPVQPECMDPALVKKLYGERLSFWGTIGTQTTMPFGTPHEIARTVRQRIETAGHGGGLVLAPSHLLEPEVPWANIEAFMEAALKYGRY